MNRLSALDATFLYLETPDTPMHIGSLTIFAPAKDPDTLFERFREHTRAQLDRLPSYYRRLKKTPLSIDHPVWVRARHIDLDYHVRHLALPSPGTMAQLRDLTAQLHAVPLDRSRPLWRYHLIEGLEDGGFAVYIKVHHAAMDGVAGLMTLGVVYDLTPDAASDSAPQFQIPFEEKSPDFLELTSTAIADFIRQAGRAVGSVPALARTAARMAPNLARDARTAYSYAKGAPRTLLNVPIARERVFATSSVSLAEAKGLAKARGATLNDLVLGLCAGGLRRYLQDRGGLPDQPLVAAVPASIRSAGDVRLNNQVLFTLAHLPTNLSSPTERLDAARDSMNESKDLFAEARDLMTTDLSILGAPMAITALGRLTGTRIGAAVPSFFNVIISNVPGPRRPVYCLGAPARHYFPVSIPYHNCALNITVQSYLDNLDFGLVAWRGAAPDAQRLAEMIVEEFEALRQEIAPDAPAPRKTQKRSKRASPAAVEKPARRKRANGRADEAAERPPA